MPSANTSRNQMLRLLEIMAKLRDPLEGCPWDLEQNFDTIAPYTIEEAYEVAEAINRKDFDELKSELGDLLLQVVFHSQMAEEAGYFTFEDVAKSICDKMVSRHPHVFGEAEHRDAAEQTEAWEEIKAQERQEKSANTPAGALDDVAFALPALMRSQKLQKRAARVGFDWPDHEAVFLKLDEEINEVRQAIDAKDQESIAEELGDLLFVSVNLSRKLGADAEEVLRAANDKFLRRFRGMETLCRDRGLDFASLTLDQQESLWQDVKKIEKS